MNVDKYCDDGLIFDVYYTTSSGFLSSRKMIFPITYTEQMVKEYLITSECYKIQVVDVIELEYCIRLKKVFLS